MNIQSHIHERGQTIIEVIIVIGLVVLVLITLVTGMVLGIRNNQTAKEQELAKNRTQEAIEWFRNLRDQMGWDSLQAMVSSQGNPVSYCLPTLPGTVAQAQALTNRSCLSSEYVQGTTLFYRTMVINLPLNSNTEMDVTVNVTWTEGGKSHASTATLVLQKWQ